MFPTLLIDVDGVLIKGPTEGGHWSDGLQNAFGFDKFALRAHFFQPFWADIVTGRDSLIPRLEQALSTIGTKVSADTIRDYWFSQDASKNVPLCDWLYHMRVAGHRVMLATNQDHSRAAYLMQDLKLQALCNGIYYSAALGVAKPSESFFQAITEKEKCAPSALILIDDTLANVAAAQAAGLHGLHYTGQPLDEVTAFVKSVSGSVSSSITSK